MLIGYARVSTDDQKLDLQLDALGKAGVEKEFLFTDKLSGLRADRPGLVDCKRMLRKGDTLVVWRLDRLGRSLKELAGWLDHLQKFEIAFRSLTEGMDTTTPGGRMIFGVFASVAAWERDVISERTKAGLRAAKARGRMGGRPRLYDDTMRSTVMTLAKDGRLTIEEIAAKLNISAATIYRNEPNVRHKALGWM